MLQTYMLPISCKNCYPDCFCLHTKDLTGGLTHGTWKKNPHSSFLKIPMHNSCSFITQFFSEHFSSEGRGTFKENISYIREQREIYDNDPFS